MIFVRNKLLSNFQAVVLLQKDQISFGRDKTMPLIHFILSAVCLLTLVTSISLMA